MASYKILSSDGQKWYDVRKLDSGKWYCGCPHHLFRKAICKHIEAAQAQDKLPPEAVLLNISWDDPVPMYLLVEEVSSVK